MAKPRPWTVTPHAPLAQHDDNLWSVAGDVPGFPRGCGMGRRMAIVRLADGRLVFHNAVPLDEPTLAAVRALGTPAILIVPMHLHAMDAHAFREKLGLRVFTGAVTLDKVREIVAVDGTLDDLAREVGGDAALSLRSLDGTKFGEAAWVSRSGERASLLLCDAVQNSRPGAGFNGWMFRMLGFTGQDLRTPPLYKRRAVADLPALRRSVLALADTPNLARLVPSHGEVVEDRAAEHLREAATRYL